MLHLCTEILTALGHTTALGLCGKASTPHHAMTHTQWHKHAHTLVQTRRGCSAIKHCRHSLLLRMHTHTLSLTHIHTHIHTHTHTHTLTHTLTHTQTHRVQCCTAHVQQATMLPLGLEPLVTTASWWSVPSPPLF